MQSLDYLKETRLDEALSSLKDEVRKSPADIEKRANLFALNCVFGNLDKAATDLKAIASLDPDWCSSVQVYRSLLAYEQHRDAVYSGESRPNIMGEPEPWLAWNIQALALEAEGKSSEAWDLRRHAWDEAPNYPAKIDDIDCLWITDTDMRLGPALEVCLDGKYYWIPFSQIDRIEISEPAALVEAVWLPARLELSTGATVAGHLSSRYPGSESSDDDHVRIGQRTVWHSVLDFGTKPFGQKTLESENATFGLSECRSIKLLNFRKEESSDV